MVGQYLRTRHQLGFNVKRDAIRPAFQLNGRIVDFDELDRAISFNPAGAAGVRLPIAEYFQRTDASHELDAGVFVQKILGLLDGRVAPHAVDLHVAKTGLRPNQVYISKRRVQEL